MSGFLDYSPDLSIPSSSPSPDDFAAVIYNEHRSAHGPELDDSLAAMAHVLLNRVSANMPLGQGTAPTKLPEKMSDSERRFFEKARAAVNHALAQQAQGIDPTHGARFFQHVQAPDRRWSPEFAKDFFATEKFEGKPLAYSFGSFENSAPSPKLPRGAPIYLNIYGDQPWAGESTDE